VVTEAGRPIFFSTRSICATAWPSETPGARSKPMVACGNWLSRASTSGASLSCTLATVPSGTCVPLLSGM
jgi:hypothetical protein